QDAHEAIRPTNLELTPVAIKESLSREQFRLYQLIWRRFIASRMSQAVYHTTSVRLSAGKYRFTASASKIKFDGFLSVYTDEEETKADDEGTIGNISKDSKLLVENFEPKQHFTQAPANFTEAALVKAMEEFGIGRPSTYAPTITTLLARRYVIKENKNFYVTELGEIVNKIMVKAFPAIVDVNFTENLESLLDKVEEGTVNWKTVIRNFYPDLDEAVKNAEKELEEITIEDEVTEVICEECGRNMVIKYGPHGKFLACPGFPDCRNTKTYLEKIGVACPKCSKDIVIRKTKKGRRYFGCEDNPECDFMSWQKPVNEKCPECGGMLLEKGNKLVCFDEQCGYIGNKQKIDENDD
ncbi:MAG: type I DNA topoisomerase, partial [Clostridiales bacterium]|nr:type I DNA topoisomerase [Clostridiales bacterium]